MIKIKKWLVKNWIVPLIFVIFGGGFSLASINTPVGVPSQVPVTVEFLLENKTAKQKANIKGIEIAKIKSVARINVKFSGADYDIEIVNIKARESGVEVFVKAWKPDGTQIAFGDGTVEIEKFIIINPPILVEDPLGEIKRETTDYLTGAPLFISYREDLKEALLQTLAHSISIKKQIFTDENLIQGKIGKSHEVFYSDAGDPGSTTIDGEIGILGVSTWAGARDAATGGIFGAGNAGTSERASADRDNSSSYNVFHAYMLFDTSSLGDTDTIDSVTLSLDFDFAASNVSDSMHIIETTPASNTTLVLADFDQVTFSSRGSRTEASLGIGSYEAFTLTGTLTDYISRTGVTKLGAIMGADLNDVAPVANGTNAIRWASADEAGTTQDPKLDIEHTAVVVEIEQPAQINWFK